MGVKKEIPDVRAIVVGDGPERERLMMMAKALNLKKNVVFTGFLPYERVIALMKASKVFVLPSRREGFGMVVLEAMASGLPVVTLNTPMNAARFLVENGRGGVVVEENKFGRALMSLLVGEALRRKMGKRTKGSRSVADGRGQPTYGWRRLSVPTLRYTKPCSSAF
ncbi:glycosyltransferase [Thermococcus piezophilus]|uniref:glycosyltransferase n=1 Tax=Thermococcus piezophilus TaxID=1712654 RepID=UPI001F17E94B